MPNKNTDAENPDKDIEAKVDAMMDISHQESPADIAAASKKIDEAAKGAAPEIDIFSDVKSVPEVPGAKPVKPVVADSVVPAEEHAPVSQELSETDMSQPVGKLEEAFADKKTDAAVDDIVHEEADKVLEAEDTKHATPGNAEHKTGIQKLKQFFRAWWRNKLARNATIAAILMLIVAAATWPTSRYWLLNTAGVRSSASLRIIDNSTNLPLKNVAVSLGSYTAKTNENGEARFAFVRLGPQTLHIERVAFAPINKQITIGWGSNPLGELNLMATGAQYTFSVHDYLSGEAIKAEAVSGEASAFADKNGKIVLTVDNPESDTVKVNIKASDYRVETLTFAANTKDIVDVRMVPAQPLVYVTKQSGRYDLYKVDVDGKNKNKLLAGTGRERQNMTVATSPDGQYAALVSSRGTTRDENGYLLDTLTLINLKTLETKPIDEAQNIRLTNWVGKRLVYSATYAAPSAATGNRQRIITYNTEDHARKALAMSDYFNGIVSDNDTLYYVIASSDPDQTPGLYKTKLDGNGKQTILAKQIWSLTRVSQAKISLETPDGWYEYKLGDISATKGNPPSDTYISHQYVSGKDSAKSLWVDNRDGKGVLLVHDTSNGKDQNIISASGLTMPVRWLSPSVIAYRITNSSETADYVKSLNGGEAKKIVDVTNTGGLAINY